jgi:RNA polymerase sigma factor (sigma-70 family)
MVGMRSLGTRVDERVLIDRARAGRDGFAAFYDHFETPVLRYFVRATGASEVAADLTAETLARALESLAAYDSARGRADQWVFGIARNVLNESFRRGQVESAARRRLGLPDLVLDDHTIETIERLSTGQAAVDRAFAQLPAEQREAIDARVLRERDYPEIARELRCSEAVVRQRVSRGLRALRTRLTGE